VKRGISFILVMLMALCMVPGVALAADFNIDSLDDLLAFASDVNGGDNFSGKVVELNTDIDLHGITWTPLASFAGEFDGNGHTISNFKIDATSARGGFFNIIEAGEGERVHDLTLSDVTATVGNNRFGTLANSVQGIVNRVTVKNVTVTTTHTGAWVGGMCAFMSWPWMNDCTVENLTVNAAAGADLIGGFACILQKNSNMVFDNLDVKGFKVTVADTDSSGCGVGGFVVQTQRGWEHPKVTNCDVSGIDITASGLVDVGGFIAWPGAHTTAENCTTQGKIDVTGVTDGNCFAGGFFGNLGWNCDLGNKGHNVINCTADVDITTKVAPAGGFVGSATVSNNNSMYAEFTNCEAKGDITCIEYGTANIGGFAGDADRGVYNNCSAAGTVTNKGTGEAGGFIGLFKDVTPKYDHRYPSGTRDYLADESTISNCTGSSGLGLIGSVESGVNLTLNGNGGYFDLSADKTELDFGTYYDVDSYAGKEKRVTVTNNSSSPVAIKLAVIGDFEAEWDAESALPNATPTDAGTGYEIPAGGELSFTVKPKADLSVGNHTGIVRVAVAEGESEDAYLTATTAKISILKYITHTVSVSANPDEGGDVTGGGIYQEGTEATVEATPTTGYEFVAWKENGVVVIEAEKYTFTVDADRNLVAEFIPHTHELVYAYTDDVHWQECIYDDCPDLEGSRTPEEAHSYTNGVCVCGKTEPPAPHTHNLVYDYDDDGHWQVCSDANCPDTDKGKTEPVAHSYTNGVCVCGKEEPQTEPEQPEDPKPTKPDRKDIKVKYEGGNRFSTNKSAVPTSVEIDGVPVSFVGDGRSFTVSCIEPGNHWITVRWHSTSVTTNFTADASVVCIPNAIPKTGDMPIWAAIAEFLGF